MSLRLGGDDPRIRMSIDVTCDRCGQTAVADEAMAGEAVECPGCGHVFTVPVVVDLTAARPVATTEVYAPAAAFGQRPAAGRSGAYAGLGPWPVYAAVAAVAFGTAGILSPWPVRVGLVVLPLAAVGVLVWELPAALGWVPATAERRRPDVAATVVRAALTLAAAGGLAVWGLMVQGREVFDWAGKPAVTAAPAVVPPPEVAAAPAVSDRPRALFAVPTPSGPTPSVPTATPGGVAVVRRPTPATTGPVVMTDVVAEREATAAEQAKRDADVQRREQLSLIHLRALAAAAGAYAKAHGTYPATTDDLPKTRELRAAVRSPFDVAGRPAVGYVVLAGGQPPSAATAAAVVVYDAAELADRGAAVGVAADGRPVYLDADSLAEERTKWASP